MFCTHQLGMSAQSIADGSGRHYPHDPSDLLRCINYSKGRFTTAALQERMTGLSVQWDRLMTGWDHLVALLADEMENGDGRTAPLTYAAMKRVLAGGITCGTCEGTGRGVECGKCKGTGRRSGGRCRAEHCFRGADFCPPCNGRGFTTKKD